MKALSFLTWLRERAGTPGVARLLGPGRPLDPDAQARMEALLGRNLSEVRVHETRQAGEMAARLGAEAFTIGPRVFAAPDRLAEAAPRGLALLGHELVHVVQQTQPGPIAARDPWEPATPGPGPPGAFVPETGAAGSPGWAPGPTPPVQFAGEGPPAGPEALEEPAVATEQAVAQKETEKGRRSEAGDPTEIAERVYRLMQYDLRLERERMARG